MVSVWEEQYPPAATIAASPSSPESVALPLVELVVVVVAVVVFELEVVEVAPILATLVIVGSRLLNITAERPI